MNTIKKSKAELHYNKAESYYNKIREDITKSKTIRQLVDSCDGIVTMKMLNRKFKGNLEKSKEYCIKEMNIIEHEYFDRMIDDVNF